MQENQEKSKQEKETQNGGGGISFGTPVAMPGAVSLSLDPEGESENFYADDSVYFVVSTNNGYSGDLELALIPESFLKDIMHENEDTNGVIVENKDAQPEHFALLFDFTGDQKKIRHCMYYCTAQRAGIAGDTKEDKTEVKTEKLAIKSTPLPNGIVKAKTGTNTTDSVYNSWFSRVYVPDETTPLDPVTDDPEG